MMKTADRILLLIAGLISFLNAGILTGRAIAEEFPLHLAIPAILAAVAGIIWLWLSFGSRDKARQQKYKNHKAHQNVPGIVLAGFILREYRHSNLDGCAD